MYGFLSGLLEKADGLCSNEKLWFLQTEDSVPVKSKGCHLESGLLRENKIEGFHFKLS
jgi:hypothetical protein